MKRKLLKIFDAMLFCVVFFFISLLIAILTPSCRQSRIMQKKIECKSNLRQLLFSQLLYQNDKELWPAKNHWCDLIKRHVEEKGIFECPADKTGPCSYAMNENIPADVNELPDDLVLLFESSPGWNQVGGPDDVVTGRHDRPGANIAFADGHVEFVDAEDIPNLRWTVEQKP